MSSRSRAASTTSSSSAELEASARYIERTFEGYGYRVETHRIATPAGEVRNVEVEVKGAALASEIIVVGAHYDSVVGAVGANDNGSGVAAVLELARLFRRRSPHARCAWSRS